MGQYEFVIAQNAVPTTGENLEVSGGCSNVWPNSGRPGLGINAPLDNLPFGRGGGGGGYANNVLIGVIGGR